MMPVIRIPDPTFARLQALGTPFVDTPATVIERLLDFYNAHQSARNSIQGTAPAKRLGSVTRAAPPPRAIERRTAAKTPAGTPAIAVGRIPQGLRNRQLSRGRLGSIEQKEFTDLILASLHAFGGAAQRRDILDLVESVWGHQFQPADRNLLDSQDSPKVRWVHNSDWAKRKLLLDQLLHEPREARRGTWVLTEKGKAAAALVVSGE